MSLRERVSAIDECIGLVRGELGDDQRADEATTQLLALMEETPEPVGGPRRISHTTSGGGTSGLPTPGVTNCVRSPSTPAPPALTEGD